MMGQLIADLAYRILCSLKLCQTGVSEVVPFVYPVSFHFLESNQKKYRLTKAVFQELVVYDFTKLCLVISGLRVCLSKAAFVSWSGILGTRPNERIPYLEIPLQVLRSFA
jgi:hypothetical protein